MEKTILMGLVIGAIAIAMVAAGSSSVIPVTADKDNAQGGLNKMCMKMCMKTQIAHQMT